LALPNLTPRMQMPQIGELETLVGDFQGDNDQLHAKL
jgi:hypothetical protein